MATNPAEPEPEGTKAEKTVIVNGTQKTIQARELSFEDVINLDYNGNPPTGDNWEFSLTYYRKRGDKHEGSLVAGQSVKVKDGMIFNVIATDKS